MAVCGTIENVAISGMACSVPQMCWDNCIYVSRFGLEQMAKFEKMVGVVERRIAGETETTATLSCHAAGRLRECGYWTDDNVDALVFVSQTPDFVLPATACCLQGRLGIRKDCVAFDVNLGCSGFVYGVFIASSLLRMPDINRVLLLGGDTISKLVKPDDASAAPLFGDAGFAAVLERRSGVSPIRYAFMSDGSSAKSIEARHGGRLVMDGMDVFNFTINEVPNLIKDEMSHLGLGQESIDWLVLHQANKFVLKQVAMMTGFPMKKVPVSMDRFGNTSSASIPLTLCDMKARGLAHGVGKVMMSGFGVGLSWGTLVTDFDFDCCCGIINGR